MPSHARLDLFQVHILPAQQHLAEYALVSIVVVVVDRDGLAGNQLGQVLLRLRAKCLAAFRRIDTLPRIR